MAVGILMLTLCVSQVFAQVGQNPCLAPSAQESCAACIATAKECAWCTSEDYLELNLPRCDTIDNHKWNPACESVLQFPSNKYKKILDNPVQDGDRPEDAIQIQPQSIRLRIRPNSPMRIPIVFRMAENYPVDLYYLMDLSKSMEDDKENLAQLGKVIADRMSNITKDFRLGFGSFVDKVVSPFVSIVPAKLKVPCQLTPGQCVPPYGFSNRLSLDLDTSLFSEKVRTAPISGNLDAPEGGFDAIMQAIVCEREIGWRNVSRRMLVLSTDAGFHYAGDGKLGGIVKPNDGRCHMVNDEYVESSYQDYPSVGQISNKIKEKSVNIIFAVTKDRVALYEKLSRYIDSSTTGTLADDSKNIVDLIQQNYERITSKVKMTAESSDEQLTKVEFFFRCNGTEEVATNECGNIKIGDMVDFEAEITVKECPKDRTQWRQNLYIKPAGYRESLKIQMDLLCECDCEKTANEVPNSPKCSGNGLYECGICKCNQGFFGNKCHCKAEGSITEESTDQCIAPNATLVCSGRGHCECGQCKCDQKHANSSRPAYSGIFCECDDESCPRDEKTGKLCSGRGRCQCGNCICDLGFSKTDCSCDTRQDKCMGVSGECNGRGDCVCNTCRCKDDYSGPTCERCGDPQTCGDECDKYAMCIECRYLKNGKHSDEECDKICPRVIAEDEVTETLDVTVCTLNEDDVCTREYSYKYEGSKVIIVVEPTKKCKESVNVLAIVGGVVGGIVALGLLLLLIWKLITFIYDSREFAKFEKERQNAKWDTGENPIYKQATSTFKNPTYGAR